jgi:hypothetical protein
MMNKSPFPGMDPYLEGEMWVEFHQTLAHQIRGQLMPLLKPKYVTLLEKYYAITQSGVGIVGKSSKPGLYPDIHVTRVKEAVVEYETITAPAVELISPIPQKVPILNGD